MSRGNAGLFARLREITTLGADARARRHKDIRRWLRAEDVVKAAEEGRELEPEALYVPPTNTDLKALPLPDGGVLPLTRKTRRALGQRNRHKTPKSDGNVRVVADRKGRLSMSAKEPVEVRAARRAKGVGRPR